jgi:hypothetical protein
MDAVLRADYVQRVILADRELIEMLERSLAAGAAGIPGTPLEKLPRRQ